MTASSHMALLVVWPRSKAEGQVPLGLSKGQYIGHTATSNH